MSLVGFESHKARPDLGDPSGFCLRVKAEDVSPFVAAFRDAPEGYHEFVNRAASREADAFVNIDRSDCDVVRINQVLRRQTALVSRLVVQKIETARPTTYNDGLPARPIALCLLKWWKQ